MPNHAERFHDWNRTRQALKAFVHCITARALNESRICGAIEPTAGLDLPKFVDVVLRRVIYKSVCSHVFRRVSIAGLYTAPSIEPWVDASLPTATAKAGRIGMGEVRRHDLCRRDHWLLKPYRLPPPIIQIIGNNFALIHIGDS
jgi:hypothetical protein